MLCSRVIISGYVCRFLCGRYAQLFSESHCFIFISTIRVTQTTLRALPDIVKVSFINDYALFSYSICCFTRRKQKKVSRLGEKSDALSDLDVWGCVYHKNLSTFVAIDNALSLILC